MSLHSLISFHDGKNDNLTIWIFHENLDLDELTSLKRITKGFNLKLIRFPKEKYEKELKIFDNFNHYGLNLSVVYRLFMQELLPSDVDLALYLDNDTIINGNLRTLFQAMDLKKDVLAGKDVVTPVINGRRINDYFNAGVFILNLKSLREVNFNLLAASINRLTRRGGIKPLRWIDQDVLNVIFEGRKQMVGKEVIAHLQQPLRFDGGVRFAFIWHTFMNNVVHNYFFSG